MRKFLVSAAIIGLIAGFSPALAQDREHQDQGAPQREQRGGPPQGQRPQAAPERGRSAPAPQAQRSGPENRGAAPRNAARGNPGPASATRGNPRPETNAPRNATRGNPPANAMRANPRPAANGPRNAMRGASPSRDFSSVRNYHQNFNAARRFHATPYVRPRGYYVQHWTWGETLPPLFWARQYWLLDFAAYELPPPPIGAVWVRVGADALLIDQTSGMIIEVDYGVFY